MPTTGGSTPPIDPLRHRVDLTGMAALGHNTGLTLSAGIAQLVERLLAMQKVAGSNPVSRSNASWPHLEGAHEREFRGRGLFLLARLFLSLFLWT